MNMNVFHSCKNGFRDFNWCIFVVSCKLRDISWSHDDPERQTSSEFLVELFAKKLCCLPRFVKGRASPLPVGVMAFHLAPLGEGCYKLAYVAESNCYAGIKVHQDTDNFPVTPTTSTPLRVLITPSSSSSRWSASALRLITIIAIATFSRLSSSTSLIWRCLQQTFVGTILNSWHAYFWHVMKGGSHLR